VGHINMTRVVLGGLLAGLVINISEVVLNAIVLEADLNAALARMNLPPVGTNAIAVFVVMGFVLGIVSVWLYAAIRPRFEPGAPAAACAGVVVWFLAYCYGSIGFAAMGMFPARMIAIALIWGLFELVIATVAGAWVYSEAPEIRRTSPPMPV
jgi:hypothetical protein